MRVNHYIATEATAIMHISRQLRSISLTIIVISLSSSNLVDCSEDVHKTCEQVFAHRIKICNMTIVIESNVKQTVDCMQNSKLNEMPEVGSNCSIIQLSN